MTKNLQNKGPSLQFVLPTKYQKQVLHTCYDDMGPLGVEHFLDLLCDRFHWVNMSSEIEDHIRACNKCPYFKTKPQSTKLYPILTTHPMEIIHIDYLTIESRKSNKEIYVLVVTDHLT